MADLSERFEKDFRQSLLEDDPGEYELPVSNDGIAELSERDIERIVRLAVASLEAQKLFKVEQRGTSTVMEPTWDE